MPSVNDATNGAPTEMVFGFSNYIYDPTKQTKKVDDNDNGGGSGGIDDDSSGSEY